MPKKIKIIIFVLALISLIVSFFIILKFYFRNDLEIYTPVDSQTDNSSCDDESKKYLSLTYPSGQLVESIFKGEVTNISDKLKIFEDLDDNTEAQLIAIRINDSLWIEYTIVGDVLVKMGDSIKEGDILAKASGDSFEIYDGANIIIWAYDKDNNVIPLPLE